MSASSEPPSTGAGAAPSSNAAAPTSDPTAAPASADPSVEELQETVSRLFSHPGVQAVLILNKRGDVIVERAVAAAATATAAGGGGPGGEDQGPRPAPPAPLPAEGEEGGGGATGDGDGGFVEAASAGAGEDPRRLARHVQDALRSIRALLRAACAQHPRRPGTSEDDGDGTAVSFVQIRSSGRHEVLVSPHRGYVLAVVKRAPASSSSSAPPGAR
jgi:hypothetical protein